MLCYWPIRLWPVEFPIGLSPEERASLTLIEATYSTLDMWGERGMRGFEPAPKSSLAVDDALFADLPMSQSIWQSMLAAHDHLLGVQVWLKAREKFPVVQYSVLRGALVGSAQAVWLLAGASRPERQMRGLRVAEEATRHHLAWSQELTRADAGNKSANAAMNRHLQDRLDEIRCLRVEFSDKAKLNTTEIVEWAANHTFQEEDDRLFTRLLWKAGSGDAHALGWPRYARRDWAAPVQEGPNFVMLVGDLRDIADYFLHSFGLLKEAWRLLELRGSPPY